ncbi:MAG: tetratricopeptide repeat protein [Chloroflexi bacterium]|nr:tetratricopeptide repeat protein [Chloroflexota bacterium]
MARIANYYRILQVDPDADQEVIEAAYRRLAQKYHPDVNQSADAAAEHMKKINIAYETLRDPVKRAAYDQQRAEMMSTARKPRARTVPTKTTALETPQKPSFRRIPVLLAAVGLLIVGIVVLVILSQRQQAAEVSPITQGDAATHLAQGRQFLEQGKVNEAIAEFQSALRLDANSVEGHFQLGNAYFQQGKLEEAAKEFQKAVELAPENIDARSNLGAAYYELGQFDKATSEFKKAIALKPEDADIHYNLGAAYVQQFQLEAGIAEFKEALRLNPDLTRAYFGLGNAYKLQGNKQEAIQALEKFLSLSNEADLRAIAESLLAELKRQ